MKAFWQARIKNPGESLEHSPEWIQVRYPNDHNNPEVFDYRPCLPIKDFRQIVSDEWQDAVEFYELRPGNITEKVVSKIMNRLIKIVEKQ